MDELRSLVVERCNNKILIEVLSPTLTEGGSFLFPHLERFAFHLHSEPTTIFPNLAEMARARSNAGAPLSKVSSDQCTTFRNSDVESLRRYVSCVQLNTRANSPCNQPVNAHPYNTVPDQPPLSKEPGGQSRGHSPVGGLPSTNKSKNPLADLAALYSRG